MVKKGLGRGLDVLIPLKGGDGKYVVSDDIHSSEEKIVLLPMDKIVPNPRQPRRSFVPEKLAELVASIREKGIIQPILVHKAGDKYEIIAGERRWRAAQELDLPGMPAIIRDASDVEVLELSLIENIQREDLNPIEEAFAYKQLISEFNFRQEDLAQKVGKDRSSISNTLRLLKLPAIIQNALVANTISMGHARALLALPTQEEMLLIARKIIEEGLSVRETERIVKGAPQKVDSRKTKKKESQQNDTYITAIQDRLKDYFGTKVHIKKSSRRRVIEIEYYSDDDLDRILGLIEA